MIVKIQGRLVAIYAGNYELDGQVFTTKDALLDYIQGTACGDCGVSGVRLKVSGQCVPCWQVG